MCVMAFSADLEYWRIDEYDLERCCQNKYNTRKEHGACGLLNCVADDVSDVGSSSIDIRFLPKILPKIITKLLPNRTTSLLNCHPILLCFGNNLDIILAVEEEMKKELEHNKTEDDEDFGNGRCAGYQRFLWDLMEKPYTSLAAKVAALHYVLWQGKSLNS